MSASNVQYRLQGASKVFHLDGVDVPALRGVDLEINRGELMVILGPSGSGKSTLLNILGGLERASSGAVYCGDVDLSHADDRALTRFRRDRLGFVFQAYNLASSLTACENVQLATDLVKNPIRPEEALELVGMRERMHHFPSQLSGGEQQRVAIARAIAKRPEVLLCDEPTGALDVDTGIRVLSVIQNIHKELQPTVVIISHNSSIGQMANRVCHISNGRVQKLQTNTEQLAANELQW